MNHATRHLETNIVLIILIPASSAKITIKSIVGVVRPIKVRIPSIANIENIEVHEIRSILRRSKISDNILFRGQLYTIDLKEKDN